MSMFASYNKNNAKGTLVGNWVEEEALRAATGFSRRHVPGPRAPPSCESVRIASTSESTHDRVLLHANENGRTTYETTLQASTNYGGGVIRVPTGPRKSMQDGEAIEVAREVQLSEKGAKYAAQFKELQTARSKSTVQACFAAPEPSLFVSATRVPRGRNGARVTDTSVAHLTRREVDSLDRAKLGLLMQQQHQNQGIPVTRYSYALATGVGLDFGTTGSDSTNPFGRSCSFTNDIHDPTKRHAEATEPGSSFDERVGMTIHQRSALQRLITALKQDESLLEKLKRELSTPVAENNGGVLALHDFRTAIAAYSVMGEKDAIHAFMYFDKSQIGAIQVEDFFAFCGTQLKQATM